MALDHDGTVGEFRRSQLPKMFEEYRAIKQAGIDDPQTDGLTKASLQKCLARLDDLRSQWLTQWQQLGLGQAWSAKEQDERENALLRVEAQLTRDCPNIFKRSYYVPVRTTVPDDMEI